jgi:hypothetical protein
MVTTVEAVLVSPPEAKDAVTVTAVSAATAPAESCPDTASMLATVPVTVQEAAATDCDPSLRSAVAVKLPVPPSLTVAGPLIARPESTAVAGDITNEYGADSNVPFTTLTFHVPAVGKLDIYVREPEF